MKNYLWHLSVFAEDRKTPIQTMDIPGSSVEIKAYAKRFQGDRYEAVPKPLECLENSECQYDHLFFSAMKIGGELPNALVD